jgi:hypothetical protein
MSALLYRALLHNPDTYTDAGFIVVGKEARKRMCFWMVSEK